MQNVRFLFKGVKIDERTQCYIEKRLANVEKLEKNILQAEVEIDLDKKGLFRVEIMIKTPRNLYRVEETSESIEGSTDMAIESLMNQIRRRREKFLTKIIRGARSIKKKMSLDKDSRF